IEPDYYDCPLHFRPPCDNHPPLGMAPGEAFLAEVYTVLSGDERRWSRTVFILTYDEHGGFFDHVPPLPVKYRNLQKAISFDSTGPRVPARARTESVAKEPAQAKVTVPGPTKGRPSAPQKRGARKRRRAPARRRPKGK